LKARGEKDIVVVTDSKVSSQTAKVLKVEKPATVKFESVSKKAAYIIDLITPLDMGEKFDLRVDGPERQLKFLERVLKQGIETFAMYVEPNFFAIPGVSGVFLSFEEFYHATPPTGYMLLVPNRYASIHHGEGILFWSRRPDYGNRFSDIKGDGVKKKLFQFAELCCSYDMSPWSTFDFVVPFGYVETARRRPKFPYCSGEEMELQLANPTFVNAEKPDYDQPAPLAGYSWIETEAGWGYIRQTVKLNNYVRELVVYSQNSGLEIRRRPRIKEPDPVLDNVRVIKSAKGICHRCASSDCPPGACKGQIKCLLCSEEGHSVLYNAEWADGPTGYYCPVEARNYAFRNELAYPSLYPGDPQYYMLRGMDEFLEKNTLGPYASRKERQKYWKMDNIFCVIQSEDLDPFDPETQGPPQQIERPLSPLPTNSDSLHICDNLSYRSP
jgi:hypothetical protein